jgi:hypothetical protein
MGCEDYRQMEVQLNDAAPIALFTVKCRFI